MAISMPEIVRPYPEGATIQMGIIPDLAHLECFFVGIDDPDHAEGRDIYITHTGLRDGHMLCDRPHSASPVMNHFRRAIFVRGVREHLWQVSQKAGDKPVRLFLDTDLCPVAVTIDDEAVERSIGEIVIGRRKAKVGDTTLAGSTAVIDLPDRDIDYRPSSFGHYVGLIHMPWQSKAWSLMENHPQGVSYRATWTPTLSFEQEADAKAVMLGFNAMVRRGEFVLRVAP